MFWGNGVKSQNRYMLCSDQWNLHTKQLKYYQKREVGEKSHTIPTPKTSKKNPQDSIINDQ